MTRECSVKIGDKFVTDHVTNHKAVAITDSFWFKPNDSAEEIEYVVIKLTFSTGGHTIYLRRVSNLTKQKGIKLLDWD